MPMRITVEIYGSLRGYVPNYDRDRGLVVEIPAATTVKDLLARLNIPPTESGMVTINRRLAEDEDELTDGASVVVLPFAGGG